LGNYYQSHLSTARHAQQIICVGVAADLINKKNHAGIRLFDKLKRTT